MPTPLQAVGLTGGRRYRSGWFGKQILQVEYVATTGRVFGSRVRVETSPYWRDATSADVTGLFWLDTRPTTPPPSPRKK